MLIEGDRVLHQYYQHLTESYWEWGTVEKVGENDVIVSYDSLWVVAESRDNLYRYTSLALLLLAGGKAI